MFTHQNHLRHLLRTDQYTSEAQHRAEVRHLFQPAWHPLCAVAEIPKPGDFLTFELLETPILLRNFGGELRAFLNVCPHRHARLTSAAKGNTEALKCQYHGWEYNADGRTGKIPDARAFRPWDREHSCLKSFRVEKCGDMVFVNFSDTGPSLREWLGPLFDRWAPYLGGDYRFTTAWEADFPCNWKVIVENSLESYHIPMVHPKTFKDLPPEENAWHELEPNWTSFKTILADDFAGRAQRRMVRALGAPVTMEYWHYNRHPHITVSTLDVHRLVMCAFPISPTACRYRSTLFTLRGSRRGPIAWATYLILRSFVVNVSKKVFNEDGGLFPEIQRGLNVSPHPGVIGTREERIYYLQKFVQDNTRGPHELPQVGAEPPANPRAAQA